jgi:hypothetical protein
MKVGRKGDDRAEYLRRLVIARCPELSEADLTALAAQPAQLLPVEIADAIADLIDGWKPS